MVCGRPHGGFLPCFHQDDCQCFYCTPTNRKSLPAELNIGGRPVWEPPVLNYNYWLGDEYDKQRAALLKYIGNDVVRTTKILDLSEEKEILNEYLSWIENHIGSERRGWKEGVNVTEMFWEALWQDISIDFMEVTNEVMDQDIEWPRMEDGQWLVKQGTREKLAELSRALRASVLDNVDEDAGATFVEQATLLTEEELAGTYISWPGDEAAVEVVKAAPELGSALHQTLDSPPISASSLELHEPATTNHSSQDPEAPFQLNEESKSSLSPQDRTIHVESGSRESEF